MLETATYSASRPGGRMPWLLASPPPSQLPQEACCTCIGRPTVIAARRKPSRVFRDAILKSTLNNPFHIIKNDLFSSHVLTQREDCCRLELERSISKCLQATSRWCCTHIKRYVSVNPSRNSRILIASGSQPIQSRGCSRDARLAVRGQAMAVRRCSERRQRHSIPENQPQR